jgi:antitoxin PrlF
MAERTLKVESTLTDRYQTTVPEMVRRALRLRKRDKISYLLRPDGEVVLTRAEADHDADPVLGRFLDLLARDMADNPQRLQAIEPGLVDRIRGLTDGVAIDLDARLPNEDAASPAGEE